MLTGATGSHATQPENDHPVDAERRRVGYLLRVTILQTVAVYVGIPALVYLVIILLTVVPSRARKRAKYRPGQQWDFAPQWWAGDHQIAPVDPAVAASTHEGGARGTW